MKALLAQRCPRHTDPAGNAAAIGEALAGHADVDLAVFPELFLSGYCVAAPRASSCRLDDEAVRSVMRAAGATRTAVVFGLAEQRSDGSIANTAACVDEHGRLAAVYRKAHLFGPAEQTSFSAGSELVVVELAGVRAGLLICFDMEFPEPARQLALAGAQLLITIAANMAPYGPDHALACRARALDNRLPHLYANRVGRQAEWQFVGASTAVDRDGAVIARAGNDEEDLVVEIAVGQEAPPDVQYLSQLRPDLRVRAATSGRSTEDHPPTKGQHRVADEQFC